MKYPKSILSVFLIFTSILLSAQQNSEFTITSSGVMSDGSLSVEFTGEGEGVSMPLEWTTIPEGTKYFALNLWHLPHPTDTTEVKSYWLVYNIPSEITRIDKNAKGLGIDGYNGKDQTGYDPMKSKGPGLKEYNLTIYALAEKLEFSNDKVYRADLIQAIEGKVLGESTLKYTYETSRKNKPPQELGGSEGNRQSLSDEQKEKVKAILSNYNVDSLSADDAKAIHEAFRQAGLRIGREVETIMTEVGFSPQKLKELAPPRDRK